MPGFLRHARPGKSQLGSTSDRTCDEKRDDAYATARPVRPQQYRDAPAIKSTFLNTPCLSIDQSSSRPTQKRARTHEK